MRQGLYQTVWIAGLTLALGLQARAKPSEQPQPGPDEGCPRYGAGLIFPFGPYAFEKYQESLRSLVSSVEAVDRCLKTIEDIESWKSAWGVDDGHSNKVVEFQERGARLYLRVARDLIDDNKIWMISPEWSTFRRMGYISMEASQDGIVKSLSKPDQTYDLNDFRQRLLFMEEFAAAAMLELSDDESKIATLQADIQAGRLGLRKMQEVNQLLDSVQSRGSALKDIDAFLARGLPRVLIHVGEKFRPLLLQKLEKRAFQPSAALSQLVLETKPATLRFDGQR